MNEPSANSGVISLELAGRLLIVLLALWKGSRRCGVPQPRCRGSPAVIGELLESVGASIDDLRILWEQDLARPTHLHSMVAGTLTVERRLCVLADTRVAWCISPSGERAVVAALDTVGAAFSATDVMRPHWNRTVRELWYSGMLIKRLRRAAPQQELILETFEELGWPQRIDDPLPGQAGCVPAVRLHDAINRLNGHMDRPLLQFGGDGTGCGICWRPRNRGWDGYSQNRASTPIATGSVPDERV